jgi:hypothetical protein
MIDWFFLYTGNALLKFSSLQIEDCGVSFHFLKKQKLMTESDSGTGHDYFRFWKKKNPDRPTLDFFDM